jgi:hypothetical protein
MLEKSLDELEDEVKNILVIAINLVISSGDAKSRRASRATLQQNSTGINQFRLFNGIVKA